MTDCVLQLPRSRRSSERLSLPAAVLQQQAHQPGAQRPTEKRQRQERELVGGEQTRAESQENLHLVTNQTAVGAGAAEPQEDFVDDFPVTRIFYECASCKIT